MGAHHLAGNVRRLRQPGGLDLGGYRYSAFGETLEDTVILQSVNPLIQADNRTQPLRWKGMWRFDLGGGVELYDARARMWSPKLGTFLSVDEFSHYSQRTTLWGWPNQNPIRWRDPRGRGPLGTQIGAGIGGIIGFDIGFAAGGGVGLLGLAGGPAVVATVPTGAIIGGSAGLVGGGILGAALGNAVEDALRGALFAKEHTKGARPSTEEKHQQGKTRRKRDRGGEGGDKNRRPPRTRPPGWKGPWPASQSSLTCPSSDDANVSSSSDNDADGLDASEPPDPGDDDDDPEDAETYQ